MFGWAVFNAVLFAVLVPGTVLSLPAGASFKTQVLVHAVVFAVAQHFLGAQLKRYL
jgi:hypothetical protein